MNSILCLTLTLITTCLANTTTPPAPQVSTVASGCVVNGVTYTAGESFQQSPCRPCFCTADGFTQCAIVDCFFTPCVDAINDPTKCCPVCPNGENCRHKDGTIIKKGEVYNPDANTSCMCPSVNHFGPSLAVCATRVVDPVVDPVHVG